MDVVSFNEEDEDGQADSGPKHWHVFDVIARSGWDDGESVPSKL